MRHLWCDPETRPPTPHPAPENDARHPIPDQGLSGTSPAPHPIHCPECQTICPAGVFVHLSWALLTLSLSVSWASLSCPLAHPIQVPLVHTSLPARVWLHRSFPSFTPSPSLSLPG